VRITIHKQNDSPAPPKVSLILLDWSVREHFQAFEWLPRQNVPREMYELIWIELYDRVTPEALDVADVVITCHQQGKYHKHKGYNIGLLQARGQIITICDSDAVFPPDFIASILNSFQAGEASTPLSLVLMHYQWRTDQLYPNGLSDISQLSQYEWKDLWPNVGACMSVRKVDAIRFGGFDEDLSYRGYMCGPYDLGWRLVNAGIPEIWHDEQVALWHFAHPDPVASFNQRPTFRLWREISHPHVLGHAMTAVEAFSTGRLLPLRENPEIHTLRLKQRRIGTAFEETYARFTGPNGFSKLDKLKLRLLLIEPFWQTYLKKHPLYKQLHFFVIRQLLLKGGPIGLKLVCSLYKTQTYANEALTLVRNYKNFSIALYKSNFYALNQAIDPKYLANLDEQARHQYQRSGQLAIAPSLAQAKQLIDELTAK
jgi:hypothetical protein